MKNKIINAWKNNRVLFVLFVILIVCFIIIMGIGAKYFIGNNKSSYGDRLEITKKVKVSDKDKKEYQEFFKNDENVSEVKISVTGKIIYIRLTFKNISLVEAQSKALQSIEKISEKIQKTYDINFTLIEEKKDDNDGFTIMGAKNKGRSSIVWNNNTPVKTEENE
ncbi:MAG: hypothetical protein IJ574_01350 [Bacilli bacterium]|nr:hypothetical protein [Bacilli bacterium]